MASLLRAKRSNCRAVLPKVHICKVVLLTAFSCAFLLPIIAEMPVLMTLVFSTVNMAAILCIQLLMEYLLGGELKHWQWRAPRLLKDWQDIEVGKLVTSDTPALFIRGGDGRA